MPRSSKQKTPKKSFWRIWLPLIGAALLVGITGGVAASQFAPTLVPRLTEIWHHAPPGPKGGPTGTPAPSPQANGTSTFFQQFNNSINSYQSQPVDSASGLRLIIPKISVNAPIVERGLVQGVMVVAPGDAITHFIYSAYPGATGNAILYSHAGTEFRHLDSLAIGDTIVVQTPHGAETFRVRELRIVSPTSLGVLDATASPVLTLLTCYPFGVDSSRLAVIADYVGG
jgi:LPXTG-site transpeptidase (sortase) family protein